MKYNYLALIGLLIYSALSLAVEKVSSERLNEVDQRSQQVVSYSIGKTKQTYTKTPDGGVQYVVAKSANDTEQIKLIQAHLLKMSNNFSMGDFSDTERIHGTNMPGLKKLKMAHSEEVKYKYKALANGAQIHYSTEYPLLAEAIHEWFDAQIAEHGDAEIGDEHNKHHATPNQ